MQQAAAQVCATQANAKAHYSQMMQGFALYRVQQHFEYQNTFEATYTGKHV